MNRSKGKRGKKVQQVPQVLEPTAEPIRESLYTLPSILPQDTVQLEAEHDQFGIFHFAQDTFSKQVKTAVYSERNFEATKNEEAVIVII